MGKVTKISSTKENRGQSKISTFFSKSANASTNISAQNSVSSRSTAVQSNDDDECIPDTQLSPALQLTKAPLSSKSLKVSGVVHISPPKDVLSINGGNRCVTNESPLHKDLDNDFCIPDTPQSGQKVENSEEEFNPRKKFLGRNFLTSPSQLLGLNSKDNNSNKSSKLSNSRSARGGGKSLTRTRSGTNQFSVETVSVALPFLSTSSDHLDSLLCSSSTGASSCGGNDCDQINNNQGNESINISNASNIAQLFNNLESNNSTGGSFGSAGAGVFRNPDSFKSLSVELDPLASVVKGSMKRFSCELIIPSKRADTRPSPIKRETGNPTSSTMFDKSDTSPDCQNFTSIVRPLCARKYLDSLLSEQNKSKQSATDSKVSETDIQDDSQLQNILDELTLGENESVKHLDTDLVLNPAEITKCSTELLNTNAELDSDTANKYEAKINKNMDSSVVLTSHKANESIERNDQSDYFDSLAETFTSINSDSDLLNILQELKADSELNSAQSVSSANNDRSTVDVDNNKEFSASVVNQKYDKNDFALSSKKSTRKSTGLFSKDEGASAVTNNEDSIDLMNSNSANILSESKDITLDGFCLDYLSTTKSDSIQQRKIFKIKNEKRTCTKPSIINLASSKDDVKSIVQNLSPTNVNVLSNSNLTNINKPDESCSNVIGQRSAEVLHCELSHEDKAPYLDYNRHVVCAVSQNQTEKILELVSVPDKIERTVVLTGFWCETQVSVDDVVNVIGDFDESGCCRVSDSSNYIIVNADLLISTTSVASSGHCMRRCVLSQKFKGSNGTNEAMLYGSILHAIFQKCLTRGCVDLVEVRAVAQCVVEESGCLNDLFSLGLTLNLVWVELEKYLPQILTFIKTYVKSNSASRNLQQNTTKFRQNEARNGGILPITIDQIADVEENIWSPRFGIKGKVDLTVSVNKVENGKIPSLNKEVVPLELKTGRSTFSVEHKGQVLLYTLMCSDRRSAPSYGILLYLKDLSAQLVQSDHVQKKGLIQLRNELAHYFKRSETITGAEHDVMLNSDWLFGLLPRPINDERTCSRCPQLLNCSLYYRSVERTEGSRVLNNLSADSLSHLTFEHLQFFTNWITLQQLESYTMSKRSQDVATDLWMKYAAQREMQSGRSKSGCISNVVLVESQCKQIDSDVFSLVFCRHQCSKSRDQLSQHKSFNGTLPSLFDFGLSVGTLMIISAQNRPYLALTTGVITLINSNTITLTSDRDLRGYKNQNELIYRLDTYEGSSSLSTGFSNLSQLMSDNLHCKRLRELIIERRKPEFNMTLSKTTITKVKSIFKKLNQCQKTAVLKIMMCKDYILIKGFPGTGKTSTIVSVVRILVELGHSVLLTSYTHSAVDNLLLKLKSEGVDFMRIGKSERINPELLNYSSQHLTKNFKTVEEIKTLYDSKRVVGTTCLGLNHSLFTHRRFDFCIVDEATQMTLTSCLGPLFLSDRFILVGDLLQLPPLVQSRRARKLGFNQSLFSYLDGTGATFSLNIQYRMNREIMRLSNEMTYEGKLECSSGCVAEARLVLKSNPSSTQDCDWLRRCLSGDAGDEVLWLDTDLIKCDSSAENLNILQTNLCNNLDQSEQNSFNSDKHLSDKIVEANLVCYIIKALIEAGIEADDIGAITPYRKQVQLLRHAIKSHVNQNKSANHIPAFDEMGGVKGGIEVNTVDQYQGRDKSVIILSFAGRSDSSTSNCKESNKNNNINDDINDDKHDDDDDGDILRDVRRLNVAVTRAKHKQIFVGSVKRLIAYPYLNKLISAVLKPSQIVAITAEEYESISNTFTSSHNKLIA